MLYRDGVDVRITQTFSKPPRLSIYSRSTTLTVNMLKIAKRPRTRCIQESPKLTICQTSSSFNKRHSSSLTHAPPWFSHKSTPCTQAANRIFVLSSQKQLGIKLQTPNTLFEKTSLPCHEAPTQQGRRSLR